METSVKDPITVAAVPGSARSTTALLLAMLHETCKRPHFLAGELPARGGKRQVGSREDPGIVVSDG